MIESLCHFPQLVEAIGEARFGASLLTLLRHSYDADHCAIFLMGRASLREITSSSFDGTDTAHRRATTYVEKEFWKRDPMMSEAWQHADDASPRLIKLDVGHIADHDLRTHVYPHVAERILLCGRSVAGMIGLSMVKAESNNSLSTAAAAEIEHSAPLLLSIVGRHALLTLQKLKLRDALTSLADIESIIVNSPERFPRREAQVCARILYGIYTAGIALELSISEETVTTYRKRIYIRLGIGTQRELMLWYINRWSESVNSPGVGDPLLPH